MTQPENAHYEAAPSSAARSESDQPLLELRGVNKSFGIVHVLHDVDFAVYPGQVTALVGDNGAGKSTLVKVLAGVHQATTGTMTFRGQPVTLTGPNDALYLFDRFLEQINAAS